MNSFLVWYVLSVVTIQDGKLVSSLGIAQNLTECEHTAARMVAADQNLKWSCHEMTTETKNNNLIVKFPNF